MAKGKNKRLPRKGKGRKNDKHTFLKKQWYTLISPSALKTNQPIGWTCCKKPTGTEVVSDFLKGRVAEMCYADITSNFKDVPKKIKMVVDDVKENICATSFYGFELSRECIFEMLRKRQTLVNVFANVKTKDGNMYRLFLMVVTNRRPN